MSEGRAHVKIDPDRLSELLGRFPLLAALDEADRQRVASRLQQRTVRARQPVFLQGEVGHELFLLLSGAVRIVAEGAEGREITLALLTDGNFFGDMALLDGHPRSASAIALEDCDILVLRQSELFEVLERSPASVRRLLAFLSERLRRANERIHDLSLLTVRQRLAGVLRDVALREGEPAEDGILLPSSINHRVLAETLSTSRETVSREIAELRARGLVAQNGRRIRVLDAEGLKALIEGHS